MFCTDNAIKLLVRVCQARCCFPRLTCSNKSCTRSRTIPISSSIYSCFTKHTSLQGDFITQMGFLDNNSRKAGCMRRRLTRLLEFYALMIVKHVTVNDVVLFRYSLCRHETKLSNLSYEYCRVTFHGKTYLKCRSLFLMHITYTTSKYNFHTCLYVSKHLRLFTHMPRTCARYHF